ncbi:hypothetical protein CPAR01_04888 [Colletotrichum paranaense]|uniref:Uncharacterized protein n=1 Tax=Colletotrichum paranaense TaxID=1914294 RepID=A0ABQ9SXK7_9PEZI|nr:uncharacterized protein CPAR01_04888 [Colletotrichum paranaense]KAK1544255.1 hypothetical protein CPAR01_04888 [Colletotrichum paranaense]
MALLPGPAEISRYMWRTRRRLDRVWISNEASISRLSCLDMYETCTEAGEDKVEQNLKGVLTWLIMSHPRLSTDCDRRTRYAGCLAKLSKRRSRKKFPALVLRRAISSAPIPPCSLSDVLAVFAKLVSRARSTRQA